MTNIVTYNSELPARCTAPIVEEILCVLSTTFNRTYGTLHEMKLIPDIAKVAKIMRQNYPRHRGKNLVILFC